MAFLKRAATVVALAVAASAPPAKPADASKPQDIQSPEAGTWVSHIYAQYYDDPSFEYVPELCLFNRTWDEALDPQCDHVTPETVIRLPGKDVLEALRLGRYVNEPPSEWPMTAAQRERVTAIADMTFRVTGRPPTLETMQWAMVIDQMLTDSGHAHDQVLAFTSVVDQAGLDRLIQVFEPPQPPRTCRLSDGQQVVLIGNTDANASTNCR